MTSDEQAGPDPTQPDPYAEHPEESAFPGAGESVDGWDSDCDGVRERPHLLDARHRPLDGLLSAHAAQRTRVPADQTVRFGRL